MGSKIGQKIWKKRDLRCSKQVSSRVWRHSIELRGVSFQKRRALILSAFLTLSISIKLTETISISLVF